MPRFYLGALIGAFALLLSPISYESVIAQTSLAGTQYEFVTPITPPPVMTKGVAARIGDDMNMDIVYLSDSGAPTYFSGPAIYNSSINYPAAANTPDIAVLPSATGGQDQLLTISSSSGLMGWTRNSDSASATKFISTSYGNSDWNDVDVLHVGMLNAGTQSDIIGARGAINELLILLDAGTSSEQLVQITTARPALEIALIAHGSSKVIAIQTVLGVLVYDINGSLVGAFIDSSPGHITSYKENGSDGLAWVRQEATGAELYLINSNGTSLTLSSAMQLGNLNISSVQAVDVSLDADDELIFSLSDSEDLRGLVNDAIGNFDGNFRLLDLGEDSVTSNLTTPVITDLDNDGDSDFAMLLNGSFSIFNLHVVTANDMKPQLARMEWQNSWADDEHIAITYKLDNPSTIPTGSDWKLEFVLWRKANAPSRAAADASLRYLLPLVTAATPTPLNGEEVFDYSQKVVFDNEVTSQLYDYTREFSPIYCVMMRFVRVDGDNNTIEAWPARLSLLSTMGVWDDEEVHTPSDHPHFNEASRLFLVNYPAVSELREIGDMNGWPNQSLGSSEGPEDFGVCVEVKPLPPVDDEDDPKTGNDDKNEEG